VPILVAIAALGCGGRQPPSSGGAAAQPDANQETMSGATEARDAVKQVAADFINSYKRGDSKTLCALLAPSARRALIEQLAAAVPKLRGKQCTAIIMSGAYADPTDQPPAVAEAANFLFVRIVIGRRRAIITFPDRRQWRLVLTRGRWLIAEFPFVPPSLHESATTSTELIPS
jgi:hypothetical protein